MPQLRHEIPTKVNQEDIFQFGPLQLAPRQLLYLGLGVIGAASVWTSWPALPAPLRAAGATLCLATGVTVALWRPAGRELLEWSFVLLHYLALPRLACWAPTEFRPADWRLTPGAWAEATTKLRTLESLREPRGDDERESGEGHNRRVAEASGEEDKE